MHEVNFDLIPNHLQHSKTTSDGYKLNQIYASLTIGYSGPHAPTLIN